MPDFDFLHVVFVGYLNEFNTLGKCFAEYIVLYSYQIPRQNIINFM